MKRTEWLALKWGGTTSLEMHRACSTVFHKGRSHQRKIHVQVAGWGAFRHILVQSLCLLHIYFTQLQQLVCLPFQTLLHVLFFVSRWTATTSASQKALGSLWFLLLSKGGKKRWWENKGEKQGGDNCYRDSLKNNVNKQELFHGKGTLFPGNDKTSWSPTQ